MERGVNICSIGGELRFPSNIERVCRTTVRSLHFFGMIARKWRFTFTICAETLDFFASYAHSRERNRNVSGVHFAESAEYGSFVS